MKSYKLVSSFVIVLIGGALNVPHSAAAAKVPTRSVQVAVVPFVIEPQPFAGAPVRPDQAEELRHLSVEATKQVIRSLLDHHPAYSVAQVPTVEAGTGKTVITGTIRMPISLPPNVGGWYAEKRHGHFATATIVVSDGDGKAIATQSIDLNWDAVWWYRSGKIARNFPLDQVLDGFARKAADHAVRRLDHQILESK